MTKQVTLKRRRSRVQRHLDKRRRQGWNIGRGVQSVDSRVERRRAQPLRWIRDTIDQVVNGLAERRRVLMTRDNLRDLAALLLVAGGVVFALANTPARTLAAWAMGAVVAGVGVRLARARA